MKNITINNQPPGYSIILTKIEEVIEYCKKIFESMKTTVNRNRYEFLELITKELNSISKVLRENSKVYKEELTCFVQIKSYITYIIGQNCEKENFGHLNSVRFLLNLFKDLINAKFKYLKDQIPLSEYAKILNDYPARLDQFDDYFNEHILIPTNEMDADIELLNISMRG